MAKEDTNTITHGDEEDISDGLGFYKPKEKVMGFSQGNAEGEKSPSQQLIRDKVNQIKDLAIDPKLLTDKRWTSGKLASIAARFRAIKDNINKYANPETILKELDNIIDAFANPDNIKTESVDETENSPKNIHVQAEQAKTQDDPVEKTEKSVPPYIEETRSEESTDKPKKSYEKPELRDEEASSVLKRIAKIRDDINKEYDGGVIELEAKRSDRLARLDDAERLIKDGLEKLESAAKQ